MNLNCFLILSHLDTCNIDCVRKRMEQNLQTAIKTLRKSINKQQFYVQFSGTEYEVAQKPAKATEGHEACNTGQVLQDEKCGKSQQNLKLYLNQLHPIQNIDLEC